MEAAVTVQLPNAQAEPTAVLQFGPDKGYRCGSPSPVSGPVRCDEPGAVAVWVLDGGKPALFGLVGSGPFDHAEARRRLTEALARRDTSQATVKAASVAVTTPVPASPMVRPTYREPSYPEQESPFPSHKPQPGASAPVEDRTPDSPVAIQSVAASAAEQETGPETANDERPFHHARQAQQQEPLIVKRAPRPTPRPSVYSPLWDDVSAEFEKMLDSLPSAQPFNGNADDAAFTEVPTAGAVQCYIGSVTINGMKVFLQAVPSRPYARPAGFDHSLVSRNGECYWVKYFIQNS